MADVTQTPGGNPLPGATLAPPKKKRTHPFFAAFLPNQALSANTLRVIIVIQIVAAIVIWMASPYEVLPKPADVWHAFVILWKERGLATDLWVSFKLVLHALLITVCIALLLSYFTVMPFFRPIAQAVSKMRYLSLVGFSFVFTLMGAGGYALKLYMMVFGMTVFFITSMASVVASIPKESFDHARTLRMSEWRVVWEVVIVGTADQAFEVMRQNAAIAWLMLTMVEGFVRSEGGLGVLLLTQQKYLKMDAIYAIQIVILLVALLQDYVIGVIRRLVCPYADLTLERQGS
ncbi:MAG: nitrate ABC transporter permease [Armatimonadetes bacterium]|nr:nitrate ABC transporter permease [Armatimonadota bacterium]